MSRGRLLPPDAGARERGGAVRLPASAIPTARDPRSQLAQRLDADAARLAHERATAEQRQNEAVEHAWNAGFAAGQEAGRSQALADGLAALTSIAASLRHASEATAAAAREAWAGDTDELLEAAVEIASWATGRDGFASHIDVLRDRLDSAASEIPAYGDVQLHVHPTEAEALSQWAAATGQGRDWAVLADERLQPGEARISVNGSLAAELTVAAACRRALQALTGEA